MERMNIRLSTGRIMNIPIIDKMMTKGGIVICVGIRVEFDYEGYLINTGLRSYEYKSGIGLMFDVNRFRKDEIWEETLYYLFGRTHIELMHAIQTWDIINP